MAARSSTLSASLTTTLRSFADEALAALLRQRPDLAVPQPSNLAALAQRARTPLSVSRALDLLDEPTLRMLDGLRLVGHEDEGGPVSSVELLGTVTPELSTVPAVVGRLRELALVWGPDSQLRYPAAVAEATGPYPAGLGRPAAELGPESAALVADAAALRRTLLSASPQARAVLDRLAAGPPIGTVTDAYAETAADTPVRWLITHQLLVPVAEDTVELPREIGALLRRDTGPLGRLRPEPLPGPDKKLPTAAVDSSGAGTVFEVVRLTEAMLNAMADDPAAEVKSGGIGMQALHRLARTIGVSDAEAAILLETAYGAGLLGRQTGWLPSNAYDSWRTSPVPVRWARLARSWLSTTRDARLLGSRPGHQRPSTVLSEGLVSHFAPAHRREVLDLLASQPPGTALDINTAVDILAWRHPRRRNDEMVRAVLTQAAFLGVTARDAITGYGRQLIADPPADDPLGIHAPETDPLLDALEDILPAPIENIVVQSDLSVIVPGPPSALLTAELSLITDQESATTYRVTEKSMRAAMDAGYAAEDIKAVFTRRATGPLPQALTYLIEDVARRHGGMRAGTAASYLRSEDETLVAQVLADRRMAEAQPRRLAPTVLVSQLPLTHLMSILRQAGYAPVAEDTSGSVLIDRTVSPRAPRAERPVKLNDPAPRVDGSPLLAIVDQLREADNRSPSSDAVSASTTHETVLAALREAVPDRALAWVEYVDGKGETVRRLLRPVSMGAGYLRAEDRRTDMLHTIALHMIRSVTIASV